MSTEKEQELENRINHLQAELNSIRKELCELRLSNSKEAVVQYIDSKPKTNESQEPTTQGTSILTQGRPVHTTQDIHTHNIHTRELITSKIQPKMLNEANIGKILMGVGAILLILISFGLFAVAILPLLNETMKAIGLITFSAGLLAVSTHFHKKSVWWVIPECIGLIGLYVSFVISNVTLKVIPTEMLYVLIAGWLVLTGFYSYKREKVFGVIQQAGLFVSSALIFYNIDIQYNQNKMLFVLPFYIALLVAENVLIYVFTKREDVFNVFSVYCGELLIVILGSVSFLDWGNDRNYLIYMSCISTVLLFRQFVYRNKKTNPDFMLVYSGLTTSILLYFISLLTEAYSLQKICIALVILCVALMTVSLYTDSKHKKLPHIAQCFILFFALSPILSLYTTEPFYTESLWLSYFGLFLVLVFLQQLKRTGINDFYIIVCALWISVACEEKENALYLVITGIFIAYMFLKSIRNYMFKEYKKGSVYYSILQFSYLIIIIAILLRNIWDLEQGEKVLDLVQTGYCLILLALNVIEKRLDYLNTPVRYIISLISMGLFGLVSSSLDGPLYWVFLIVILLPQMTVNTKDLINREKTGLQNVPYGMWVGFKYTMFVSSILATKDVNSMVYSLVFLILAILSITAGIKLSIKTLRIYGLILSMISVIKLTLFDIHHNTVVSKAISFLIAGLLCLLVSYIYSRFERNIQKLNSDLE